MVMTTELEGRIRTMCNLSENIRDSAIEEGMEKGIEKGIEEGIEKGGLMKQNEIIINMLKNGLPCSQISEITGIPLDIVETVERSISTEHKDNL